MSEQYEEVTLEEAFAEETTASVDVDAEAKAQAKAEAKAAKEAKKAEEKAARDAVKAQLKETKAAEKAAKAQAKIDAKAAKEAAKAANKAANTMPEQNGVRHPKPATLCGQVWTLANELSNAINQAVTIKELLEAATAKGLNENNVRAEYHRWKKFHGLTATR